MAEIIRGTIEFILGNFTLTFFVIGLLFSLAAILHAREPRGGALIVDKLLAWHIFWVIGVAYFYNFVMHTFFGEMAAKFIGWADSPFQFEVGTASLGYSVVGFIAAFRNLGMRLLAILGPSIFTLGAAAGHIYQMIVAHNFAPGNAGVIFWSDILLPLFGFVLLWLQWRQQRTGAASHRAPQPRKN